ncbi:MAG UNVERIFIED_CONTAM: hypothetical protein LVT10_27365 [Anaerolineae bacterium]
MRGNRVVAHLGFDYNCSALEQVEFAVRITRVSWWFVMLLGWKAKVALLHTAVGRGKRTPC